MPRWGWYAFLFFSALSALSAFKFVPPGLIYGVFAHWGEGFAATWTSFVVEGISRGADHVEYHIENVGSILAVHMITGGLAVILVPLQVSRMWRRGDRRKHVYLGWALVPIVTIAALTTPPISFNMTLPFWSELGFALGSVAWFGALVMGIWAIKTKQIVRHQRWMVMMTALSFGAVSFRIQLPILRIFWDMDVVFPYLGWTCWVPNVLVVAWWWHRQSKAQVPHAQPAQ
ncbi:DUF2306 domain-containing protein [Rhodobacteraceae bacterium N5(2021)]|uniref:DUF2306 domain-containing protein n=1 Tax=Gymnodinialimonas phycosphaerae TaxID=2841589 RepID=A0A975TYA2_9RHOB|nr:DUF2306 domain-containing protein [Gymnodinialimonas phycosphaerae]MBY4892122.1 DUF2306 domain-containing protein [Gymnodinialimonas phycosphaerae]